MFRYFACSFPRSTSRSFILSDVDSPSAASLSFPSDLVIKAGGVRDSFSRLLVCYLGHKSDDSGGPVWVIPNLGKFARYLTLLS